MKKLFALILALTLLLPFAACGSGAETAAGGAVTIKVWGPQVEQELLKEMTDAFAAQYATPVTIELGIVSEDEAGTRMLEDPDAGADVFMFPNDQLRDLVSAGVLYELTAGDKDAAAGNNVASSVEAATVDGKLYAYPMTADNGYFLYYDKSVYTEDDVKSLDRMLEVANEKGKKICFALSNAWYNVSFFFGAGCSIGLDSDGKQTCDFNNAQGLLAAEAMQKFANDPAFITGDDNVLTGGMGTSIAAGVSGTWNAAAMKELLGDNYAATKLPTFTLGGEQAQLGSFGGYKLVGVNSLTKAPKQAMDLADFLTNEENQVTRFKERDYGPSNIKASEIQEVKENVALAALYEQQPYAKSQADVLSGYWTPAGAFGQALESHDTSKSLQEMLDTMVAQIVSAS